MRVISADSMWLKKMTRVNKSIKRLVYTFRDGKDLPRDLFGDPQKTLLQRLAGLELVVINDDPLIVVRATVELRIDLNPVLAIFRPIQV